ncbi:MAG: glutamine--fructose-6-phosphate transaminase (isomerizing), partial [Halobacteriota archaeon]
MESLSNLEYRGYDSAGVALRNGTDLSVHKVASETEELRSIVERSSPRAAVGIGHTRWSTHGAPTDENAHPHTDCTGDIAVVHNGIIENHAELREELSERGHTFTSGTDTEVVPHLIEANLAAGHDPRTALELAIDRLDGSYALAMVTGDRDVIYAARNGSPLVIGVGEQVRYLASDVPAFLEYTDAVIYLEDGDVAVLEPTSHTVYRNGERVDPPITTIEWSAEAAEKQGYDHYMLKEINEQPEALANAIRPRMDPDGDLQIRFDELSSSQFDDVDRIEFVACGTSYHAALYGCHLLNSRG